MGVTDGDGQRIGGVRPLHHGAGQQGAHHHGDLLLAGMAGTDDEKTLAVATSGLESLLEDPVEHTAAGSEQQ